MKIKEVVSHLENVLTTQQVGTDASHDIHHARRVHRNAVEIAATEEATNEVILAASAYLHDLVNLPKNAPNRHEASRLSAEAAIPILQDMDFNQADIEAITHCISAHSFSAAIEPTTTNAKVLQDADRLESVGALGIARTFYIAGKMDSDLFHAADPFAANRTLNDKQYAVDHFRVKLLGLADTMQTHSGKTIAKQRTRSMLAFLNQLASELDCQQPWQ